MSEVTVVYTYPMLGGEHDIYAARFVETYHAHPAGLPHEVIVVSNGGPPTPLARLIFGSIPCRFVEHDNSAWDIGGFQKAVWSFAIDANRCGDLTVFFGVNAYFRRAGWLNRMVDSFKMFGDTLYGCFGSKVPKLHVRTTGFWISRDLFRKYPHRIVNNDDRYDFEHRSKSLTDWIISLGKTPIIATWSGAYPPQQWGNHPGFYGSGNHSDCLIGDRVSDLLLEKKIKLL
jgi:hypothetical protein